MQSDLLVILNKDESPVKPILDTVTGLLPTDLITIDCAAAKSPTDKSENVIKGGETVSIAVVATADAKTFKEAELVAELFNVNIKALCNRFGAENTILKSTEQVS